MKYLGLLLLLTGRSTYPQQNVGIVHDYIIRNAQKICASHSGLHYIVSVQTIMDKGEREDYPCTEVFKVRCQDQVLLQINDEIAWCFIPKMQLDESLK